ncbi:DUF6228 family protein [Nocardioides sp. Root151]|uniref:DUF6228 family protein n=1 Tax=Nocardioides sp. Root151 TaxID=1736475 RepID=UPI000702755E|nr:DUF6228 family protein [Nocardioides sp. Root151]KQZ70883.1 hypothetical protein ASD66_11090 [Nocardioides sp. Root151]
MPNVLIGTATECLTLVPEPSVGAPDSLVATLDLEGLSASRSVVHNYASGFDDLANFFADLADAWRGWLGTRTWESLEGDLKIEARHDYGHVGLTITVRRDQAEWGNHGWRVTGDLTIEPGEQLSQIAGDLVALARG